MKEYEFTLKFDLRNHYAEPASFVDRLAENGCDDALIGIGKKGYIALEFIREAHSAYDAVSSAIRDVKKAIPHAVLVQASPDIVGQTDIAEFLGCTRQNIRKLIESDAKHAPAPVHEGKYSLWRLADVLTWLQAEKNYPISDVLLEIAEVNSQFNIISSLSKINSTHQEDIRVLVG
ncbi:MAG: DNA-binding protein [Symploca sp. SIO2E6]|nr:DNA-binding protein [Symploca sp. SIO2E6]